MAGSHWAGTERCQRRTSVTRRLHRHPPPHAPLPPPRTGRRQVKGDGRGDRAEPAPRAQPAPQVGCALLFPGVGTTTSVIPPGLGGVGMERCPGCDTPSPTLPPCPSSEQPPRPPPRPFLFLLHISLTPYSQAPPPARAGAAPPLPGLHRPPLSAPLARDNVMGEIGHSSSSLGVSSIPPFAGLRPPQPIHAASRSIGSGLAKLLGHGKRWGPHPPFPGCLHPSSSGACIPPSRGARIPSPPWELHPPLPWVPASLLLGGRIPRSRGSPASPRGHSRFSRPGPAGGGGSAQSASQGLGVCKEKDTDHGFLQALAQPLRSSASTPV